MKLTDAFTRLSKGEATTTLVPVVGHATLKVETLNPPKVIAVRLNK
jgi:hypothetical protein